ncbi:UNVERIFIED_CONTAM: hypothetical protein RF648_19370 [Kocuria sp. CPCC 205274]
MKKVLTQDEFDILVATENGHMTEEQLLNHMEELNPEDYGYKQEVALKYDCDKKEILIYRKIE